MLEANTLDVVWEPCCMMLDPTIEHINVGTNVWTWSKLPSNIFVGSKVLDDVASVWHVSQHVGLCKEYIAQYNGLFMMLGERWLNVGRRDVKRYHCRFPTLLDVGFQHVGSVCPRLYLTHEALYTVLHAWRQLSSCNLRVPLAGITEK